MARQVPVLVIVALICTPLHALLHVPTLLHVPVILDKPGEIIVGAGSNVTLSCSARGSPPLTFVWFQDEKNLTVPGAGGSADGNTAGGQLDPPPSTKLLLEKRYEIQEDVSLSNISTSYLFLMNLKLTDTSVFLCWVQNAAGYSIANFSLTVDASMPPSHMSSYGATGGTINSVGRFFGIDPNTASSAQIIIAVLALLLLLAATIICLFVVKQISKGRSSKSSASSDSPKAQQAKAANSKLSGSNKFVPVSGAGDKMFVASDYEDGATDDDEDDNRSSSSGSQSSCLKKGNTRVLAVEELDGFIDHLRSGIINMDYHSMSPVIQFNNQKPPQVDKSKEVEQQQQQQHQLTQLNHFPSASNASSQFYGSHQASNGSNSMATTVSDLSPSSGSASTSFASAQQRPHYVPTNMATLLRHQQQQSIPNCDYPPQQQQQQQQQLNATTSSYTSDYQSGYSEDPLRLHPHHRQHHPPQMMPPMYGSGDMGATTRNYHYNPAAPASLIAAAPLQSSSRPSSMNGGGVVFQNMRDGRLYQSGATAAHMQQQQQQQAYQMRRDSPPEIL